MLENLFINILEISITSAAAIAVILLISGFSEGRFRKKWRYWVWVFLAVYLIVPFKFDFPDAPIKVAIPPHEMVISKAPENYDSVTVIEGTEGESSVLPEIPVTEEIIPSDEEITPALPETSEETVYVYPVVYVGAVIWAVGAALVCGWNIAMYLRFTTRSKPWNREIRNEEVLLLFDDLKEEMGVPKRVRIYENRLIKSPMMVGYFNPRVLLPAEELLPGEYEFVLRHELTHYKRGDIWYKLIMMLAAAVHWFNPMVGTMCRYADNDIEITCDAAVVKAMAGDRRQEYCATILNIMRRGQNSPLLLSTSFYGGAKVLKRRFSAVLEPRAHRGIALFIIAVLVILISGTMVACGTEEAPVEEPIGEEEIAEELNEQQLSVEEIAEEEAEKLLTNIYSEKYNTFSEDDFFENLKLSKEAKKTLDEIRSGKTDLFDGNGKVKNNGCSLRLSLRETVVFEKTAEIVFGVEFSYIPQDAPDFLKEIESAHTVKIGYDTEKEEFTKILIFGYNWFENGSDKPVVTCPDSNGYFPRIDSADWDRWVNYEGKADTAKPEEELPSLLEKEGMMENLKTEYPEINDWKVVYEKKDYVLKNSYDPYSYSYRDMYLPEWFVLLSTEQSEEFDRLFVIYNEEYSVMSESAPNGGIRMAPHISAGYSLAEGFEKDINAKNMKNAVILEDTFYSYNPMPLGIWFQGENRMIFFVGVASFGNNRALAIEGINEPLYINRAYTAFSGKDIAGNDMEAPSGRKNDLFLEIDVSPEKNREMGSVAYYDYETKTVDIYENCVVEGLIEYPQIYYIDSEILFIETKGVLSFYKTAPHNIITESFAEFGGNGKGLSEGEVKIASWLGIDKTKGGRYAFIYEDTAKEEYALCTFDKKSNILSNFSLGLPSEGIIAGVNYKSGVAYFSFKPTEGTDVKAYNYAVDARPESKHKLQENAW